MEILKKCKKILISTFCGVLLGASISDAEPVKILTGWGGDEAKGFEHALKVCQKQGMEIIHEGQRDPYLLIEPRLAAGNPPDILLLARPGYMAQWARQGFLKELDPSLFENYGDTWKQLGTVDSKTYGLIIKANSKSTFWYKPASFENLGVTTPNNWSELMDIADKYIEAGKTPYSIGGQDGWALTDYFENIYVRVAGPDMYHKLFVTHEVEWTDPTVVEAMRRFQDIVMPVDKKLAGGAYGTLSTGVIDAWNLVLRDDAKAEMYFEGGFMATFGKQNFPKLQAGKDYNFFTWPEINEEYGKPIVGGGDLIVAFSDKPEVQDVIQCLASPEMLTAWVTAPKGAIITPSQAIPLEAYSSELARKEATQLQQASAFVFDGSDLAPSAVGGDAMFIALQSFIEDPENIQGLLEELEAVADRSY